LPGKGPVSKLDSVTKRLPLLFEAIIGVRGKIALVMYLATLAKIAATNFLDYEMYIEWIRAEGMVDNIEGAFKKNKQKQKVFEGFKTYLAKSVNNAKNELKYVFSSVNKDFSKDPKLRPMVSQLDNMYQKQMDQVLSKMQNFMNNAKHSSGDKEDVKNLGNLRKKIFDDIAKNFNAVRFAGCYDRFGTTQ
jgi:hypothetical protein